MGFYVKHILPWIAEQFLSLPGVQEQRRPALALAWGRVLEIGFGFGGSVSMYPKNAGRIAWLVGLEPNPGMNRRARGRIASAPFPVELVRASAETIPFEGGSFDAVVSNWTLCTIPDVRRALHEVRRVLKPDGRFLFLEHGRAFDPRVARWQARLTPIHRRLAGGCRLDVPVDRVISESGFLIESLERYQGRPGPKVITQMYRGMARPV